MAMRVQAKRYSVEYWTQYDYSVGVHGLRGTVWNIGLNMTIAYVFTV